MRQCRLIFTLSLGLLGIVLAGCKTNPSERIEKAQKELDKAAKEQVERYAPAEYLSAQEALNRAREEHGRGSGQLAMQLADDAEKKAKAAINIADHNKNRMKDSVKRTMDEMRKTMDEAKDEYKNARELRVPEQNLAGVNSYLSSAETDLKQADKILDAGDIITAREKVEVAQNKIHGALQEIRNLVADRGAPHKKD